MSDLVSRLLAAIDETERLAREAIDPERPGTHWHWVTNETDTPVAAGELAEAQNHQSISLRTIEEFETRSVGILPAFLLYGQDVNPGAGEHIVRNDPAAVLRRCAADKAAALWFKAGMDRLERLNHVAERRPLTAAESADRAVTIVKVSEGHDYMTFMASAYRISVEEEE